MNELLFEEIKDHNGPEGGIGICGEATKNSKIYDLLAVILIPILVL